MNKKLLAAAVAGAFAMPMAAMAQSSVTISGVVNVFYETAGATGATNTVPTTGGTVSTFDVKNRDRMQDGNASNIRFTAVEDLGTGMQAFAQVESAVVNNANTRNDGVGTGSAAGTTQNAGGWGTRNTGVGLRGQAWGEVLIGIWDFHYNEQDIVDGQRNRGAAHGTTLGLTNTFGMAGIATGAGSLGGVQLGGRYSNVVRYQSPSWGGFNFRLAYSRPTDNAVPTTTSAAAPNVTEGTKNKAITLAPQWSNGPIIIGFSYLKDSDIVTNQSTIYSGAAGTNTATGGALPLTIGSAAAGSNLTTNKSSRLFGAYTFPFGLKLGFIYDQSKLELRSTGTATTSFGSSEFKRNVLALPISWTTDAHTVFATYAQATKLKGSIGQANGTAVDLSNVGVTPSGATAGSAPLVMGDETAAKFYQLGYFYNLSKRTNIHLNYTQIKNNSLAGYDFFSNTVGMANTSFGADPRSISLGLRHAF